MHDEPHNVVANPHCQAAMMRAAQRSQVSSAHPKLDVRLVGSAPLAPTSSNKMTISCFNVRNNILRKEMSGENEKHEKTRSRNDKKRKTRKTQSEEIKRNSHYTQNWLSLTTQHLEPIQTFLRQLKYRLCGKYTSITQDLFIITGQSSKED